MRSARLQPEGSDELVKLPRPVIPLLLVRLRPRMDRWKAQNPKNPVRGLILPLPLLLAGSERICKQSVVFLSFFIFSC